MDINETLRQLRDRLNEREHDGTEYQELFHALDEWLSKGGFLPDDWARPDGWE